MNNCVLYDTAGRLTGFFMDGRNLTSANIKRGRKEGTKTVLVDINNFTVNTSQSDRLMLFYLDENGHLGFASEEKGEWNSQTILKNQQRSRAEILVHAVSSDRAISLIFNIEADGGQLLECRRVSRGKWEPAQVIERIRPLPHAPYYVRNISGEHHLLIYNKAGERESVCYRELNATAVGGEVVIQTLGSDFTVADCSFLTTTDGLYTAMIVKNSFTSQLLFKRKVDANDTNAIVLWEGRRIQKCLVNIVNDLIYVFFDAGGIYYSVSDNDGLSFSRPRKYTGKVCSNPAKLDFIAQGKMRRSEFYAQEVYVDENELADIQILPDLYKPFYEASIARTSESQQTPTADYDNFFDLAFPMPENAPTQQEASANIPVGMTMRLERLEIEVEDLKSANLKIEGELVRAKEEIQTLQSEKKALENEKQVLEGEKQMLESEKQNLEQQLLELEREQELEKSREIVHINEETPLEIVETEEEQ